MLFFLIPGRSSLSRLQFSKKNPPLRLEINYLFISISYRDYFGYFATVTNSMTVDAEFEARRRQILWCNRAIYL